MFKILKEENNKNESKILKEDSYEDGIFYEIEEALRDAGMNPSRFIDDGVLTKNIGWTVYGEDGDSQQLTCDGSYLSESKKLNENEASLIKALKILFDNSTLNNVKKVAQAKQLAKVLNIDEKQLINESKKLDEDSGSYVVVREQYLESDASHSYGDFTFDKNEAALFSEYEDAVDAMQLANMRTERTNNFEFSIKKFKDTL